MATNERNESDETDETSVVVLVCLECGTRARFEGDEEPGPDMECEKCGNTVFRRFDGTEEPDEVQQEFREETERDMGTDEAPTETTSGDLLDLNNP